MFKKRKDGRPHLELHLRYYQTYEHANFLSLCFLICKLWRLSTNLPGTLWDLGKIKQQIQACLMGYVSNMTWLQIYTIAVSHALYTCWAPPTSNTAFDLEFAVQTEQTVFVLMKDKGLEASSTIAHQKLTSFFWINKSSFHYPRKKMFPKTMW